MLQTTTMTQKGQVTIPLPLRRQLGLVSGSKIRFVPHATDAQTILLSPVSPLSQFRGMMKTKKQFSKSAARKVYMKDVLSGKI